MLLTTIGIFIGLSTGAYLTRFIEQQLYQIDPLDLPIFASAAILMILTAGIAAYYPARRAVHTDPMKVLRYE